MQENIIQKTKFGILWNLFERFGVQGLGFIFGIILARILSPNDYGTIALLTVFIALSSVFIESGFSKALIQRQDRDEYDFSTVFIFNVVVAIVFYLILFFVAPFIAEFYKIPELTNLARVLFLVLILQSLRIVQTAKFQINVDFKKIAFINLISIIIGCPCGLIFALNGFGVWSLVWQNIISQSVAVALFWYFGKWIPKTGFSKKSFKKLFAFSSNLIVIGIIGIAVNSAYTLIIAKFYSTKDLGFYNQSETCTSNIFGVITGAIVGATFPLLSSLKNDKDELIRIFKKLLKTISLTTIPAMFGFAMISENFILVLLTEKWLAAAPLLFWFALSFIFTPLNGANLNLLAAIGRSDLLLKIETVKMILTFLMMAITFPISLKAVVIGRAVLGFIAFFINTYIIGKYYDFGAFRQIGYIWRSFVASFVMVFVIFCIDYFISNPLLSLILSILIGTIVYIFTLWILKEEEFFIYFGKIKPLVNKKFSKFSNLGKK
ncbi:lipopolysaccharide biosynthesis protein [Campylobacter sp. JMF_01 NE2]|uniref:lipopolysaccharide biosynthesis protein n=1 Tax=unclassified Campylobacter TaxID=2593542 RepID=UPI0022EA0CEB|nr:MULTISPECIES: lipopolysaccharide biosynthesis protein [unclassified Campylobacter]MDA3053087.1 lipopolysaccharide biosynthesis protein [Campylobacter sp. JMF_03 NE3]MDA3067418.1 lipopolysaccharide biosynthesis protein [Campylobacter sp. JMF_01 NE2]